MVTSGATKIATIVNSFINVFGLRVVSLIISLFIRFKFLNPLCKRKYRLAHTKKKKKKKQDFYYKLSRNLSEIVRP